MITLVNVVGGAGVLPGGGGAGGGDWGGYAILVMVLSPCIVGGLWRLGDWARERRGRSEFSG